MIDDMQAKQQIKTEAASHTVLLENRSKLVLEGVSQVEGFDDMTVTLVTSCGLLVVEGEGLHILSLSLDTGRVIVEGTVEALRYEHKTEKVKRGFFSRLVR